MKLFKDIKQVSSLSPTFVSGVIAASRHFNFVQSTKITFKPIFMAIRWKYLFVPLEKEKTETEWNSIIKFPSLISSLLFPPMEVKTSHFHAAHYKWQISTPLLLRILKIAVFLNTKEK